MLAPWKKTYDKPRQHIKKQRHYFDNKGPSSQNYGFSSSHVWMWELDYKESWALKNWCFWAVVLEKTPESPLDYKESKPIHTKGNQSWIFIGKTDAEAETPILWPPDSNWLIWKDPDAGKDWRWAEKGTTEDEMVGWHHRLNGHEFEQAPGVGDGQEAWSAAVHAVTKSWTRLSDWTELWIYDYLRIKNKGGRDGVEQGGRERGGRKKCTRNQRSQTFWHSVLRFSQPWLWSSPTKGLSRNCSVPILPGGHWTPYHTVNCPLDYKIYFSEVLNSDSKFESASILRPPSSFLSLGIYFSKFTLSPNGSHAITVP